MAQHDYVIANASGATVRADINNMALAISSNNSGSSEPSTTYAYEWWIDTGNNLLKLRNSANNAWITMPFSITANNTVDINGGTVDGAVIGGSSAAAGTFTTLTANTSITGTLATAAQPNITSVGTLTGFTSTGIDDNADATAITIDSSENVGIGTTSPESKLAIKGSSGSADLFSISDVTVPTSGDEYGTAMIKTNATEYALSITSYNANGKGLRIYNNGGQNAFLVSQAGGDRFVVDGSGRVGINRTPAISNSKLEVGGADNVPLINVEASGNTAGIGIGSGDFQFFIGTTERMRINSSGGVGINTSSITGALTVKELSGQVMRSESTGSGSVVHIQFVKTSGGTAQIGDITGTTSSVAYNSGSDYRLKENVITDWDATTLLKQLKPSKFNFKDNQSETVTGFIAHEVQEVLPYLVSGQKDGENMQSMDYGKLTPLLTKAIQEQQTIIEDLKTRIETLEG